MTSTEHHPAIHAGNYYITGTRRVLAKLATLGIQIPATALGVPNHDSPGRPLAEFTRIEHAMLDWFTGRDYDQAQALIHYRPSGGDPHVIRMLDADRCPLEISDDMLCPTGIDAVAAVISACDHDVVKADSFRQGDNALTVVIDGVDVLRLERIHCQPFDRAIRDRVRTAFKGVRRHDIQALYTRAAGLPGFDRPDHSVERRMTGPIEQSCLFLGFPANWALAMRHALKQVGIEVKQNQAQELAAVFLGASSWHQLVKHQREPYVDMIPTPVTVRTETGRHQRFYRTPEEAIFAIAAALKSYPEPVVIQDFSLSLDERYVNFQATTERAYDAAATPIDTLNCPVSIECGRSDRWTAADDGDLAYFEAAQRVLDKLERENGRASTLDALYARHDAAAVLEGALRREGLPADQLVQTGNHALAVFYGRDPNGGSLRAARLRIYRRTDRGYQRGDDVAMYKAELDVVETASGSTLIIRPDYGNKAPIEIPFSDVDQLRRLLALTHAPNLFTHRTMG